MKRLSFSSVAALVMSVVAAGVLAACGGGAGGQSAAALPTFTPIPTYVFEQPTGEVLPTEVATAEVTASASGLDAEAVAKGKSRYEALKCGSCHGDAGEGTDKGSSLVTLAQTEDEFFNFIRSGGKLGVAHQYPANKLSDSSIKTLYQFMLSLGKSS